MTQAVHAAGRHCGITVHGAHRGITVDVAHPVGIDAGVLAANPRRRFLVARR